MGPPVPHLNTDTDSIFPVFRGSSIHLSHEERANEQASPGPTALCIVADDRERGAGVIERLGDMTGVSTVVKRIDCGDYLLNNRIAVERKTVMDLVASIVDGRLFVQAARMADGRHAPLLIVEGTIVDDGTMCMTRGAVQGAIASLALFFGIPCLRARNPQETANLLLYAAQQSTRHNVRTVYRHGYRPKGVRKRQLFILQGLPGIGPRRAELLLDTLGSVQAVFTAGEDALREVAGLGRTTATKIRSLISPA